MTGRRLLLYSISRYRLDRRRRRKRLHSQVELDIRGANMNTSHSIEGETFVIHTPKKGRSRMKHRTFDVSFGIPSFVIEFSKEVNF